MRLYLVRHPEPLIPEGICYGQSDLALLAPWTAALAQVRAQLPWPLPVVSSPLQRCREFALALAPTAEIDARLTELDFGNWEMLPWAEIPHAAVDAWAADPIAYVGHGGESVAAMQQRVAAALSELPQQDCAWVTHAGVMKLVFAQLLKLPQSEWLDLRFDYAGVSCIEIGEGGSRLLWHNSAHA